MEEPKKKLFNHIIPKVQVSSEVTEKTSSGTIVIISGYNENRRDKFTHEQFKDYVLWFTKCGSVEKCFGIEKNADGAEWKKYL